ncbi:MAG: PLP-dependent aminotransferase family protein [Acidobacteria bacterium]|nr:PLP-dependent aminotransferase family protein [Acidobacteriota bacterium]
MPLRDLIPKLDRASQEPLAVQLVRLLAAEVASGRLARGEPLPGSRALAEELELSRHTVMAALRELEAEGWVESRPGSGTFVVDRLPAGPPRHWGPLPSPGGIPDEPPFDLASQFLPLSTMGGVVFDLSEAISDPRLAPKDALAKAYQRALRRHGDELLGTGEPRGNQSLREHLAAYLTGARGFKVGPDQVLLTRGGTDSLALLAQALLVPGGHVAVENPGNPAVWDAFRTLPGVHLHPVPVDEEGLRVDALETLLSSHSLALVHLTPFHQFPTQCSLSASRRSRLLALAREHEFAILEDEPTFEFHGPSRPLLPLASADTRGAVVHLGSFAPWLAPGLPLGFLVASRTLVDRLARLRRDRRITGDRVLEWAMADLIRDGDFERHLARARKTYQERKEVFLAQAMAHLGPEFRCADPPGGLGCWLKVPDHLDTDAWASHCRAAGVQIHPGRRFDFQGRPLPAVFLGFAHLQDGEARDALHRMRGAVDKALQSRLA